MSIKINAVTSRKKEVAEVLRAVANWVEISKNDRILVSLAIDFDVEEAPT